MKNLICTLVLALGVFLTTQAQNLGVKVVNQTANNWGYKVVENGGQVQSWLSIPPGAVSGMINAPIGFPLVWGAGDNLGCSGNGFPINGLGSGSQSLCGATVNWTLSQSTLVPNDYLLLVIIQ